MINPDIYFVSNYKVDGVELYANLNECLTYLKEKSLVGVDIETCRKYPHLKQNKKDVYKPGLDPYLSKVVMLQLGNFERIFVIDVRCFSKEELQPIMNFLHWNHTTSFVGVNLKFEQKHLRHNYNVHFKKVIDCMIQEMCLYNGLNRSYSLAGLTKEYLGVKSVSDFNLFELEQSATLDDEHLLENENLLTPFEVADMEQIDKSTRMEFVTIDDKPFTSKQILYGADDILYPLLIAERQMLGRRLSDSDVYLPKKLFNLENNMVLVNADMELNGMPFSPEIWKNIAVDKQKEYEDRLQTLNNYVKQHYPKFIEEPNLFDFERECKIEWSSSKQVIEFFKYLNFCPKEFSKQTKKMDFTVGAVALQKLLPNEYKNAYSEQNWLGFETDADGRYIIDNDRLILAYLLMKRSEQSVTTFGMDWLKYVHPVTGRVHCNFRQILNSGRMASNSPNCQQIPNGIYRDAFCVDSGSIIASDFSNQEMRTVACLAGEEVMIQVFTEGHPVYFDDLHMATADSMNKALHPNADFLPIKGHPDFTHEIKKKRDNAKIVNFGIIYGKEAKGFAEDFGMSLEDSEDFIKTYFKAYPKLQVFMQKQAKETFQHKYISIDKIIDRRWFSQSFTEMEELNEEVREYYPEDYFKPKGMSSEEKAKIKENLNLNYPQVKELWRKFFGIRGSIQRKSTNYAVQGTSASETKAALVMFREYVIKNDLLGVIRLINSVHDEVLVESVKEPEESKEYALLLQKCMVDGANLFLDPKIMKSEPEIGKNWIH